MENLKPAFENKKALITGGMGFIGSNLARRLADLGAQVMVVDSLIPEYGGNPRNLAGYENRVKVDIADIRDEHSLLYLVQGQDYLFNLAGQNSHLDSMLDPYTDLDINCRSQLSILEACRKKNKSVKVVYAGTRQIYGVPDYLPVDEKHLLHPTDVNGINKMAGEWYHILYNNVYGIRACSLRLTNTYGPRMRVKDARQTFLGWWIRQAVTGQAITIYGDGSQLRDFNYVDDVVDAFLIAAADDKTNGKIFNLGGNEPVSLHTTAELLVKLNGSGNFTLVPFPEDRKAIDIGDYYSDFSLIWNELGWKPKIGLEEGLRKTLDYYKKEQEHYWP